MATYDDLERFALTLPETTSSPSYGGFPALRVTKRLLARLCGELGERLDELTQQPYGEVLMIRVADLGEKQALLAADERTFFTTPHYDGHPAVLVRLAFVDGTEIRELIVDAWLRAAPKRALRAYQEQHGSLPGPPG